jgi:hypothetical protein
MSSKKNLCAKCNKEFEDGYFLVKKEKKLYHHTVGDDVPPLVAIMSCSLLTENGGKVGIYYKDKFYDLEKNIDKLNGINVSYRCMFYDQKSISGHKLIGDISFLDNLIPD